MVKHEGGHHESTVASPASKVDSIGSGFDSRSGGDKTAEFFDRLHVALGIRDQTKRARVIAGLADNLDVARVREALDRIQKSHIPNRKEIMAQLFARWGEIDPLAAMDFAQTMEKASERSDAVSAVLNGWMEHDPAAAEKWVSALPIGAMKNAAWQTVILAHAASDPSRALALAQQTRLPWQTQSFISEAIFGNWTMNDPKEAAAQAGRLPWGFMRMEALNVVAKQWAEADPEEAITWAQSLPDRLVSERVHFGGRTVMGGADRTNTTIEIMGPWLRRDSDAAFRWLSQLPDDPWKTAIVSAACTDSVDSAHDPKLAVELAHLIPEGEQRDEMLSSGADRLSELNVKVGLAMLSHETDSRARLTILEGLANNLKGEDLLAALHQVQSDGTPIGNLIHWADPETAAHWAAQQPNAELLFRGIGVAWLRKDPERAEEFVRTLPPALKDGVYLRAVEAFYPGPETPQEAAAKFERATRWIPDISNPTMRQSAYRKLAERWLNTEPDSARRWIDSIPIPPKMRSDLLKKRSSQ
jgi:hypothetical protein